LVATYDLWPENTKGLFGSSR